MDLQALAPCDAAALAELEARAVAWPWSARQYADSLAAGHPGWGVRAGGELRAFALFMRVGEEVTLLNLVVAPELQRSGLGRALLVLGLKRMRAEGGRHCLLEVRAGNTPALALYRQLGFHVVGRRRQYYPAAHGREDAVVMRRSLDKVIEA